MQHLLLGDKNTIALDRAVDLEGSRYLPGDTVMVDKETAKELLENHYGEIVSLEFDKGLRLNGPSISLRKLS